MGVDGRGLPIGGLPRLLGEGAKSLGLARPPRKAMGSDAEAFCLDEAMKGLGDSGGVAVPTYQTLSDHGKASFSSDPQAPPNMSSHRNPAPQTAGVARLSPKTPEVNNDLLRKRELGLQNFYSG